MPGRGQCSPVLRLLAAASLGDWVDQPLSVLGDEPALVQARHDKLTEENAPYTPIAASSQIGPEDPHYGWTTSKGEDDYSATVA